MVSEAAEVLLGGVIAGWIVVVTQPIVKSTVDFLNNHFNVPKIVAYLILNILWLIAMMVFVIKVW